jgi:hypothetical protein
LARGKKPTPGGGYAGQPNRTATSSQYGQAAEQSRAQAAVPLPDVAGSPVAPSAPDLAPGAVPLDRPSDRAWEPITEGASFGPGRGLSDLTMPTPAAEDNSPDPRLFSRYLPALEAVASQPGSSHALRSFVRRLRAQVPLDFDPTGDF